VTAPTTRALYAKLATERPVKAKRYRASMIDTLARPNIHEIERARLTEALRGIADVLGDVVSCVRCGRTLTDPESIERGIGPECEQRLAVSA
jgi:hypothetical protein